LKILRRWGIWVDGAHHRFALAKIAVFTPEIRLAGTWQRPRYHRLVFWSALSFAAEQNSGNTGLTFPQE
jgi:hypothetical protein